MNRVHELAALEQWWRQPGAGLGVVWGRKRVGKTALADEFGSGRRTIRHICRTRPYDQELAGLSEKAAGIIALGRRSLTDRPFVSWDDAFEVLADAAETEPLLVILDEFPELVNVDERFPEALRALWDRAVTGTSNLKLLLLGSAVGIMEAIQAEDAPLYGRMTLRLHVRPFRPHEAALMLPHLAPAERAAAWGVCGGIPRYLDLWDDTATFEDNIDRLVCNEHGLLLSEGDLVLGDEDIVGHRRQHLPEQVLRAVASGKTSFQEIRGAVTGIPTRTLEYLTDVRLLERVVPVTENPARTKLTYYRVADNFLAFWLRCVEPHREQIELGLARPTRQIILAEFSDFMGARYEHALRDHIRLLADSGDFGGEAVAVGEWWNTQAGPAADPCQLDAVVLAGRKRSPVAVGEAKWTRQVNGSSVLGTMVRKLHVSQLADPESVEFIVCARDQVVRSKGMRALTANDIFPDR